MWFLDLVMNASHVSASQGVGCLFEGISLTLGSSGIRGKVLKGVLVNAVVFLLVLVASIWGVLAATAGWVDGNVLTAVLGWVARAAIVTAVLFVAPVLYALLGEIVMPAFRSAIFELARDHAGGPEVDAPSGVVAEAKAVGVDIRRLVRFVGFTLLLLPLNLVPGIGSVAFAVCEGALAAQTMGWDIIGRHFELHGVKYDAQKRWLKSHRSLTLSVGGVACLLCLIPVAQLLFVTTNVVGAGLLSAKLDGA